MTDHAARPFAERAEVVIRAVLTSKSVMKLKATVRDLRWRGRSRAIRNPPLPSSVRSIVFVCEGNICRSPFAALLAQRVFAAGGRPDIVCGSAGLRTSAGRVPPSPAIDVAARYGVPLGSHKPRPMTAAMAAAYDMVLVMDPAQAIEVIRRWPGAKPRVFLLSLFDSGNPGLGPFERCHLIDPFGKDIPAFEHCYRRIHRAIGSLAGDLAAGEPPPRRSQA